MSPPASSDEETYIAYYQNQRQNRSQRSRHDHSRSSRLYSDEPRRSSRRSKDFSESRDERLAKAEYRHHDTDHSRSKSSPEHRPTHQPEYRPTYQPQTRSSSSHARHVSFDDCIPDYQPLTREIEDNRDKYFNEHRYRDNHRYAGASLRYKDIDKRKARHEEEDSSHRFEKYAWNAKQHHRDRLSLRDIPSILLSWM